LVPVLAAQHLAESFVDPSATLAPRRNVHLDEGVYVAPFAALVAGWHSIEIGRESNVQDNVRVAAWRGDVVLGEKVILAHGCTVRGPARIGTSGTCPLGESCPSFIGFNAEVAGATIEKDAMVSALARVGPGVTIPSGRRVLPGVSITANSQVASKTVPVTAADREFMLGVIEVNVCFAAAYAELAARHPAAVYGINVDPDCPFNPGEQLPVLQGRPTRAPWFDNRIIGDVRLDDSERDLRVVMGRGISLRADEGFPFRLGRIACMHHNCTFHALEHTGISVGRQGDFGARCVVHGGPTEGAPTGAGARFQLGAESVFFRSRAGDDVRIGARCLVQQSDLPAHTVVPDRTVMIGNVVVGRVEW
jgi:carbonic anhydrase/acetyltransferase-like protein (isoleucine patch superfamily)